MDKAGFVNSSSSPTRAPEQLKTEVIASEKLSTEARNILDAFPLLNFMSSTFLDPPSRNANV